MKLLPLLLLLCSCHTASSPKPICIKNLPLTYQIQHYNPLTTQTIQRAINYWNDNSTIPIFSQSTNPSIIIEVVPKSSLIVHSKQAGGTVKVYYVGKCLYSAVVKISDDYANSPKKFESIVRHELGHIIGFSDTSDFQSLMSLVFYENQPQPINLSEDEKEILRVIIK